MAQDQTTTCALLDRLAAAVQQTDWFDAPQVTLARAPGRLDIMGGIADYTGSLVCEMPLAVAAGVAVAPGKDGRIRCLSAQADNPVELDAAALAAMSVDTLRDALDCDDRWARYVLGCAWWLMQQGAEPTGLSVMVDSDVPLGGGVSSSAAIEVASMSAMARVLAMSLDPLDLALACQQVENRVVGAPCGVMDQITSAMGLEGAMLEILCQPASDDDPPAQVLGTLPVPAGYAFVGIHSGVAHEVAGDPYTDTRTAAFMAQRILEALAAGATPGRCLANVDPDQYRKALRNLLPETMLGRAFLKHYHSTHDPVTTVQPDRTYHLLAACDHHVLEADRVRRFVALLRQTRITDATMHDAGELMNHSHRSYTDCARLGHPLTDQLADMARNVKGCFGAKITGGGCGGTVAMLIRDDTATRERLHTIRLLYEKRTARTTLWFDGTSPGAAAFGLRSFTKSRSNA